MRFVTASDHRFFFTQHRFLEIEDLISVQEAEKIKLNVQAILEKRLKIDPLKLTRASPIELFKAGRDVWREAPFIKKVISKSKIGTIASELFNETPLRLAYDQLFLSNNVSSSFFERPSALQHNSCLKRIVGGLMLRISDDPMPLPKTEDFCPFPQKMGSGIFLSPEIQLSFKPFFQTSNHSLLLIVYCSDKTIYTLEKNDLFTHVLKKQGYVFGDHLRSTTHPILYR
ncbi:MAG TPA: hypothetical protein VLG49_03865 [Rhabdochlamydiaceae bacterium]|nr:hypothetical protein [Rhabdochlamydiaceae bacterium]